MTSLQLNYTRVIAWPSLAWLAICRPRCARVEVYLGAGVESNAEFFCEAAWSGDFSSGDFDCSDCIAGSGGRLRRDRVVFVGSSTTVDRLQHIQLPDATYISNSLPCLLQAAGATLSPSYPFYNRDINSAFRTAYRKQLATSAGDVQLVHFDNLVWQAGSLRCEPKPDNAPNFNSYRQYTDYLTEQLLRVNHNAGDPLRLQRYRALATVSTGYDSPAAAVIAARCGCREALTFTTANQGQDDSGAIIGERLGMRVIPIEQSAWQRLERPEIPAFASGQPGPVIFTGAQSHVAGKLLLTGYFGDVVWDLNRRDCDSPLPLSAGISGLGLTEYRLWAGFLNFPVPYCGARRDRDIAAISKSAEMQPFVIPATDYNRPICRRLVEEAGVERRLFGVDKKAAEPFLWWDREFLTVGGYRDYFQWINSNRSAWWRCGRFSPWCSLHADGWLNSLSSASASVARRAGRRLMATFGSPVPLRKLASIHPPLLNLRRYWFPWAIDRAKQHYACPSSL